MTEPTRRSYDLVADRYAAELSDELRHKPLDRALLDAFAELAPEGVVADVGCGPGHVGQYLAVRGHAVVGLDLSPGMCAATRRTTGIPAAAADMTSLPLGAQTLAGLVCMYAVIHLDAAQRARAYGEFARVLRPGGGALVAFHVSDADVPTDGAKHLVEWWGEHVDLTFRYLDPDTEMAALAAAGLALTGRLDRGPHPGVEHPSRRAYLLVTR